MVLSPPVKKRFSGFIVWLRKLSLPKKIAIVLIVLLLGWFGYSRTLGKKIAQPQYQTATVERGTLIQNVSASGTVSTGNTVNITTSATGIVNSVYVKNGDPVTKGQKIADVTLDQSAQQNQAQAYASYLQAQNSLNSAKSNMNQLQAQLFTANQTFVKGAGTSDPDTDDPTYIIQRANWLQAEANYTNQKGIIAQAEAALTSASLSLNQTSATITSPTDGNISNLLLSSGYQIAQSSSGSTGSTASNQAVGSVILAGSALQASVNLSEIDVTKVSVGQKVTMTLDAFPEKTFTGEITGLNTTGSVSSGVTTYPATITFDTAQTNIYPNMAVSAKIITKVKDNVLLVPSSAVQTLGGETTVRILRDKKVESIPVEVGDSSDTQTEIVSGLSEGDEVVTSIVMNPLTTGARGATSPFSAFGGGGFRGGGFGGGGNVIRISR